MKGRGLYVLGALMLVGFGAYAVTSFNESLTPYVSFDEARELDRTVQVAGGLVAGSSRYDIDGEALYFELVEPEGESRMQVRYHGLKPANFEEAISVVAIGRYDADRGELAADKLLVKCPSKYQGAEVKSYEST